MTSTGVFDPAGSGNTARAALSPVSLWAGLRSARETADQKVIQLEGVHARRDARLEFESGEITVFNFGPGRQEHPVGLQRDCILREKM